MKLYQVKKLLKVTRSYPDVVFCFENVRENSNLEKILSLNEPNIRMCYDLGHAHAYDDENKLLNRFYDKIVCSHLHNNYGQDDHNILKDGEIDYEPILYKLASIYDSSNCLECFPARGLELSEKEFEDFVKSCVVL